jgi:hypothetical protein
MQIRTYIHKQTCTFSVFPSPVDVCCRGTCASLYVCCLVDRNHTFYHVDTYSTARNASFQSAIRKGASPLYPTVLSPLSNENPSPNKKVIKDGYLHTVFILVEAHMLVFFKYSKKAHYSFNSPQFSNRTSLQEHKSGYDSQGTTDQTRQHESQDTAQLQ